jgi:hypothetical protein
MVKSKKNNLSNSARFVKLFFFSLKKDSPMHLLWMDCTQIDYTYYHDKRNLLKEKTTPEGLTLSYEYHPDTNLCTKTPCKYNGKIQERTYCTYDSNGQLQTHIEDDSSAENPDDHRRHIHENQTDRNNQRTRSSFWQTPKNQRVLS